MKIVDTPLINMMCPVQARLSGFKHLQVGPALGEFQGYSRGFHIWDVILPIDELIFFKIVKTTNQLSIIPGWWFGTWL